MDNTPSKESLRVWLEQLLAAELDLSPKDLLQSRRFDELGVDSVLAAFISGALKEHLKRHVDLNVLYELPDIESVANFYGR
jgi:acyl carrier protein